jgi:hypothetical protein
MGLIKLGRRLFHDTAGQFLMFAAIFVVVILAFLMAIPNGTAVTSQKMRSQTAADAGAFTGSVWLSRSLNLSANMNIGIKSVYTWMTVLTMGEALAKALYSDTADVSVKTMGQNMTLALFGSSNPLTVHSVEYPSSIRKLDTTARWLHILQEDIAENFSQVAATLGSEEASRNAGAYPATQTAGGRAIVRTNDTIPLLVESTIGDSLLYADLNHLPAALDTIPTGDPNIGLATGIITIDPTTHDIRAYYGDSSAWYDVKQWAHYYMDYIQQIFQDTRNGKIDTGYRFFAKPGTPPWNDYKNVKIWPNARQNGDSWVARYDTTAIFHILGAQPGNNKYKIDTCVWVSHRVPKWLPIGPWSWSGYQNGDSTLPIPGLESLGLVYDSSKITPTGFYSGAESTVGYLGPRVRPRRVNPARTFHTVSYVWRHGATSAPYGLGPPMGGTMFPRSAVAAASPLFSVARSEPFMPLTSSSGYEYYFTPAWDVKLTPLDSLGVVEITSDSAYPISSRNSFDNLEDLRKYVLLP